MGMRNRIEHILREQGVTAYRMAKDIGISRTSVYKLKNNPEVFPSGDVFEGLIRAYGVTPSDIVEFVADE